MDSNLTDQVIPMKLFIAFLLLIHYISWMYTYMLFISMKFYWHECLLRFFVVHLGTSHSSKFPFMALDLLINLFSLRASLLCGYDAFVLSLFTPTFRLKTKISVSTY